MSDKEVHGMDEENGFAFTHPASLTEERTSSFDLVVMRSSHFNLYRRVKSDQL
jgi:hypothetical protein